MERKKQEGLLLMTVHQSTRAFRLRGVPRLCHQRKEVLRFITWVGSTDGKSTLIGRLLHDPSRSSTTRSARSSETTRRHGTRGGGASTRTLVDGLQAEREQGITIDVAYRFFSTRAALVHRRRHPGHVQYTAHGDRRLRPPRSPCCSSTRARA